MTGACRQSKSKKGVPEVDPKADILEVDPKAGSRSDKPMLVPWPCCLARLWAGGSLFLDKLLGTLGNVT